MSFISTIAVSFLNGIFNGATHSHNTTKKSPTVRKIEKLTESTPLETSNPSADLKSHDISVINSKTAMKCNVEPSGSDYDKDNGLTDPESNFNSRNELETYRNSRDPEPGSRLDKALDHLIKGNNYYADDDGGGAFCEWSQAIAQIIADTMDKVENNGNASYVDNTGPTYPFQPPDSN